jgi:hypothetical protein
MTRPFVMVLALGMLTGCAMLASLTGSSSQTATEIWTEAQQALAQSEFDRAEETFTRLTDEFENTLEGRESLFYLGMIRLDPRNPGFDTAIAESRLAQYLALTDEGHRLYRYPEGYTFHEIARELNLPPDARVTILRPEERVITIEERVLVPGEQSRELTAQIDRLRQQVAERDSTIRAQQEELERIRRTLTGPGRS